MFWSADAPDKTILMRNKLYDRIIRNTTWSLSLFVPFEARKFLGAVFNNAENISFFCYNNVPLWGARSIVTALYDRNMGIPPAQNVLVSTLFFALRLGYKNIIVLGADHSWHETLTLDLSNRVCLKDRHFYNKDVELRPFTIDGSDERIFTMDTLFHALGNMFEGYWKIADYAQKQGATIINSSSVTYIDAFKRRDISLALAELTAPR
jgi:hypothetical protein